MQIGGIQKKHTPNVWLCRFLRVTIAVIVLFWLVGRIWAAEETYATQSAQTPPVPKPILGYINSMPPESPEEKAARHREIAERRKGIPIIVHRGAWKLAPENTLEAFNLAMDYGADGVEFDIQKSADGVLYLMHDENVSRTTTGSGDGGKMTYYQILQLELRGASSTKTRVPTLASLLELARRRRMLLHLDVKDKGIQEDIRKLFDAADVWNHVVQANGYDAGEVIADRGVTLLAYKGHLAANPENPDMDAVKGWFETQKGDMVFCDDPRPAAKYLGRKYQPVPLPEDLRVWWTPEGPLAASPKKL